MKRHFKILFIMGTPNPFAGAGWNRIGFLAEVCAKKGNKVNVIGAFSYKTLKRRGNAKKSRLNVSNTIFTLGSTFPPIFLFNSLLSFVISMFFLFVKKPDITVISSPPGDIGLGALVACEILRYQSIVDYRDEWEDFVNISNNSRTEKLFYYAVKRITSKIYAKSEIVTTVTTNLVGSLRMRGISNVILIPNGADIKIFKPSTNNKLSSHFTIFYSGSVGGYYRLDVALKALKILVDNGFKNIKLVIAGMLESNLLDLASILGISSYIDCVGIINERSKLAELIAQADVGLIPFDDNILWNNAMPAKFYEYCSCGIPVIATVHESSLLSIFIKKNEIGISSPPLDEEKLAEAISWTYHNKTFRETAGKNARLLIEREFDRNSMATKFLSLVEHFCKSKNAKHKMCNFVEKNNDCID